MGILNATPDSFYINSRVKAEPTLLTEVERMLKDGVSIIDIGGQSTRPGAPICGVDEELSRVVKVVEMVSLNFPEAVISIDTFHAEVALQCVQAGASVINDVSAGEVDENMLEIVARCNVPYIMMHMQGVPLTMQHQPVYTNVVTDIINYFNARLLSLQNLGIKDIIIDPGFGFGKNLNHNFDLLKNLDAFKVFELPLMVGISRKSMVQKLLSVNTQNALNGTSALHMVALQKGAKILRVHDVKEAIQCIQIGQELGWY